MKLNKKEIFNFLYFFVTTVNIFNFAVNYSYRWQKRINLTSIQY